MHLCHVLAADGLDDVAFVIRGMEAGPAPSLGLTVQGSTACQGVLKTHRAKTEREKNNDNVYQDVHTEIRSAVTFSQPLHMQKLYFLQRAKITYL